MSSLIHRRFAETRTEGRKLSGVAAIYNRETQIGRMREKIAPGAFERTLSTDDEVLAFADHDSTKLLGRRSSGTLRLTDTDFGLAYELDIPETQLGHDILALAERGDLGGMSFGFLVRKGGERIIDGVRTLTDIDLREISVVSAWPAYDGTSVEARSYRQLHENLWRWR